MMKNLNIGIVIVAISLMLASCGKSAVQSRIETQSSQSDISKPAASSENNVLSELTSTDFPVSSAMAENNTTSQAAVKTESSPISSKTNAASRTSSKTNPSSRIAVSSSSTSSNTSNISAADSEWIADRVLELINAERNKLGYPALSTAPKAHEIATIRAQQLTTFFSHEDELGNNAAAILYHKYKYNPNATSEFAVYDKEGNYEWYQSYGPGGSENITEGVEYIQNSEIFDGVTYSCADKEMYARKITQNFQNSSAHWSDITKAEYTGVGIGVVLTIQDNAVKYDCCILTMDRTYG
ncbi:MAG: hypothetical protein KHW79_11175 [Clostridiales bacterium]|nr:hypothetical protein [Clostridiales bacterium]